MGPVNRTTVGGTVGGGGTATTCSDNPHSYAAAEIQYVTIETTSKFFKGTGAGAGRFMLPPSWQNDIMVSFCVFSLQSSESKQTA